MAKRKCAFCSGSLKVNSLPPRVIRRAEGSQKSAIGLSEVEAQVSQNSSSFSLASRQTWQDEKQFIRKDCRVLLSNVSLNYPPIHPPLFSSKASYGSCEISRGGAKASCNLIFLSADKECYGATSHGIKRATDLFLPVPVSFQLLKRDQHRQLGTWKQHEL